jgi:hypothetical protein
MSSKRSNQLSYSPTPLEARPGLEPGMRVLQTPALPLGYLAMMTNGAEDGIRTRGPRLGKAMLYH